MGKSRNRLYSVLTLLTVFGSVSAHVGLTFPPARKLELDFLDNVRTKAPCGMPKGKLRTSLVAGSTINVTWHLAYPHRGGFRIELLDKSEKLMTKLSDPASSTSHVTGDPTAQWYTVKIPDSVCEDCTIRLLREAKEWGNYGFWSCGDVSIVKATEYKEDCLGRGKAISNAECTCDKGYWGPRCQYKDDCVADSDCGDGKCIDIGGTTIPRRQCFCSAGFHGDRCKAQNKDPLPTPENLELSSHNKTVLSDRMQLYHKIISDASVPEADKEIEFVLVVNGTSYAAIGWRPSSIDRGCKSMPNIGEDYISARRKRAARGKPQKSNPTLLEPLPMKEQIRAEPDSMNSKRSPNDKNVAKPEPEPESPCSEPVPEPETHPEPEPEAKPEKGPQSTSEPKSEPEGNSKVKAEPEPESEAESKPEAESEPSAKPESEPSAKPESEPSAEPESAPKSEPSAEPESAPKSEPSAEPETVPKSEPSAEPEAVPESEPESNTPKSKGKPVTEPVPEAEAKPEAEPESPSAEPTPTNEPSSEPEAEPSKTSLTQPLIDNTISGVEPETAADNSVAAAVLAEPEPNTVKTFFDGPSPFKLERLKTSFTPRDDLHTMDCSDIVIGQARGMNSRILDYYTRDRSTPRVDTFFGGMNDITSATGWELNGVTTIIFRRKVKSTDPTDHPLVGSMQFIWARGQEHREYVHNPKSGMEHETPSVPQFYAQDEIKYHGHAKQRGVLFLNFPK